MHALPFSTVLAGKLLTFDRTTRTAKSTPRRLSTDAGTQIARAVLNRNKPEHGGHETAMVVTEGTEGVLDTGASRTVIGSDKVEAMLEGLDPECRRKVRKVKSGTFRFGNNGTLMSEHALLLPSVRSTWVRVEVVPESTPLLISNRLLRDLDAVIQVKKGLVVMGDGRRIPTHFFGRRLTIVDFLDFLKTPSEASFHMSHSSPQENSLEVIESTQPAPNRAERIAAPPQSSQHKHPKTLTNQ